MTKARMEPMKAVGLAMLLATNLFTSSAALAIPSPETAEASEAILHAISSTVPRAKTRDTELETRKSIENTHKRSTSKTRGRGAEVNLRLLSDASKLIEFGDFTGALANLNKFLETSPKNPDAYMLRAMCRLFTKEYVKSLLDCTKALDIDNSMPEPHFIAGMCNIEMNDFRSAAQSFEKALKLDPNYVDARLESGHVQFVLGSYDKAEEELTAALKLNGESLAGLWWRSWCYVEQKKYDQARQDADKLVVLKPTMPDGHRLLGVIYQLKGDRANARKEYSLARALYTMAEDEEMALAMAAAVERLADQTK